MSTEDTTVKQKCPYKNIIHGKQGVVKKEKIHYYYLDMRKQQLILAYYTFFVSLGLFFWALFFSAKPTGFLLTVLFIPTSLYFFLSFTGFFKIRPQTISADRPETNHAKIPLMILLTLFISSMSIFSYSLIIDHTEHTDSRSNIQISKQVSELRKELRNQNTASRNQVLKELASVKDQLVSLKSSQKTKEASNVMGEKTANVGTITLKDNNTPATMYEEKSLSSKTVGTLEFGRNYTYLEKDGEWYLIFGEKEGYIQSQLVKEVSY